MASAGDQLDIELRMIDVRNFKRTVTMPGYCLIQLPIKCLQWITRATALTLENLPANRPFLDCDAKTLVTRDRYTLFLAGKFQSYP